MIRSIRSAALLALALGLAPAAATAQDEGITDSKIVYEKENKGSPVGGYLLGTVFAGLAIFLVCFPAGRVPPDPND